MRQITLILSLAVWAVFLGSLTVALVMGSNGPVCFPCVFVHLLGILVLPVFAVISLLRVRPRRWLTPIVTGSYLIVTLFIYPRVVERYLATHPGDPDWHWTTGSWCDYQYVAVHPAGDPQYAGQVCLFPPYFDVPPKLTK